MKLPPPSLFSHTHSLPRTSPLLTPPTQPPGRGTYGAVVRACCGRASTWVLLVVVIVNCFGLMSVYLVVLGEEEERGGGGQGRRAGGRAGLFAAGTGEGGDVLACLPALTCLPLFHQPEGRTRGPLTAADPPQPRDGHTGVAAKQGPRITCYY